MLNDSVVLRKLASEYYEIANSEKNKENIKLHKAVNDLKQIRPVVLIDELPWHEMNIDNELTLQCSDEYLRTIEWYLRTNIFKYKYFPADMIVPPYIPVKKVIHSTGIGISVEEEIIAIDKDNPIVSHKYNDVLQTESDLEKLGNPVITYDEDETLRRFNLVGEIIGDILPVKLSGIEYFFVGIWDIVSMLRGVTNLLIDLADRPEFMHKIAQKLTDIHISYLEQYEKLNLFDNDPYSLHCTPIHTSDLPSKNFDGVRLTRKDVWGRGVAQIFASVSKEMHEEFDIQYMKKTVGQCGLVYYGCCEPLDKKIDIVEKIPNLRKISVTPWADVNIAAEAINTKYVLSAKPNPSAVAVYNLDEDNLKKEIGTILDACKRNNCSCDIVLKDISTCCRKPQNIFKWEQIVMEMVKSY
ncbi:MAG TPA: hypothetical protein GXX14_09000 [Clostridiaceae bacterium]|nr:hypothetical protein [Clostridiaceae bacterium]